MEDNRRPVWFLLVDEKGQPYKSASTTKLRVSPDCDVDDFRKQVHAENPNVLRGVDAPQLIVYENKAKMDANTLELPTHMESWDALGSHGIDPNNALYVVVPASQQRDVHEQWDEERARKKVRSLTVIEGERMNSIAATLNIDNWQIGGIELDIRHIEPDFPAWFYVRKETQDIIKIFKDRMEKKLNTVFVGTPGVGKSMLVVLFAFYMALYQQKRVVLFRKLKNEGFSMLYLDVKNNQCWRSNKASLSDLDEMRGQDFELCLDGLTHKDIVDNFATLASFRLLATSVQYPMKNDDTKLMRCLVPFWSKLDLKSIGARMSWTEHEVKDRYYYSGGNLRDFLSEKSVVIDSIDQAVSLVDAQVAELLNTQYALGSEKQIDRLRMTCVRASEQDRNTLTKYTMTRSWMCVNTSEYALRQLGKIVKPDYYTKLWSKARMIGDKGLMGIAFENYVHTMARDRKKIELQVREYDREKKQPNEHRYFPSEFENKSYRYEGRNEDECKEIMKQLEDIYYWYPCDRGLKTIDSVAKLNINGNKVGLVQITKRDNHIINSVALDEYAELVQDDAIYIALVPDKETSDQYRLSPVDPPTTVPLYVAYIATWNS